MARVLVSGHRAMREMLEGREVRCCQPHTATRCPRRSLVDSLYFTTSTLATIGFGDLRPARRVSRVLTSLLGVAGVGLLGGLVSATLAEWTRPTAPDAPERLDTQSASASRTGSLAARLLGWARLEIWDPSCGIRLAPWAQVAALFGIGVVGFKACEPSRGWLEVAYLIIGSLTTAGDAHPPPSPVCT